MHKIENKPEKEKLISLSEKDFKWDYYRASGKGGQHRNKTDTAVRCTHEASGAVGQSADERSQWQNKKLAFSRMAKSEKFMKWVKIETSRLLRDKDEERKAQERIERAVEVAMRPENITTQVKEDGKWVTPDEEYWTNLESED